MATLVKQRDVLEVARKEALAELWEMRIHLASPKFHGEQQDYINVRDVDAFILRVKEILDRVEDEI